MDHGLAGRGLTRPALEHVAHDDLVHGGGIHRGAAEGLTNDNGPELRGRKGRQAAEIAADGSADGGDQNRRCGVAHSASRC